MSEPYIPEHLPRLVAGLSYKPRWTFDLRPFSEDGEVRGLALYVVSETPDSYDHSQRIRVRHEFVVPPVSWNRDVWAAWLRDRLADIEAHELGEFFMLDGVREFAPHHGNGEDPYRVWHVGDHEAARKKAGQA